MPPGRFSSPGTAFDWRKISDVTFNVDAGEKSAVGDVRGLMQALASCVLNLNMLQTQRLMKSRGLFFFPSPFWYKSQICVAIRGHLHTKFFFFCLF
jgi:hypothetical protein